MKSQLIDVYQIFYWHAMCLVTLAGLIRALHVRRKNVNTIKYCVSLAAMLCAGSAQAALLSIDWQAAGDNLITRDTATGLEWLDWAHTNNRSYSDVASKFGAGQEFEGFRYATRSELLTLYTDAGLSFPTMGAASNVAPAQAFTALFGLTFGSSPPNNGGVEALYDYSTSAGNHWVTAINHIEGLVQPDWFETADNFPISFAGSAIVRAGENNVPEPMSLTLAGIALAGLAASRMKRA